MRGERGQGREGMEGDRKGGKEGRMEEGKENLGSRVGRFNLNSEDKLKVNSWNENCPLLYGEQEEEKGEERQSWDAYQMAPYSVDSALLMARTHRALVKSSALYRE